MITKIRIERFKRFAEAEVELGQASVFIGPNNAGKTTVLQAFALWDLGLRTWLDKRAGSRAKQRTGVAVNLRDLTTIPVASAKSLWHDLKTHYADSVDGRQATLKHKLVVTVEGTLGDRTWTCALEFDYMNSESFNARPHDDTLDTTDALALFGEIAKRHRVVYLPPMSGLADREFRKEPGEIRTLIGQGQTAQVLRNLCSRLFESDGDAWDTLRIRMRELFDVRLEAPAFDPGRGDLSLSYTEPSGITLDIDSSGRGCQQVLLLLSYMLGNPGSLVLLDEPDAHLEILRQREIYSVLVETADRSRSQIAAASHSEVLLREASDRDVLVSFVGRPHRIDTQQARKQLRKALESIPTADYYAAEAAGWMLYLEGATDLAILRELAERLEHPARECLRPSPPVHYLGDNRPTGARDHFFGLREAIPELPGIAVFDRLDRPLDTGSPLIERQWSQREIENYLTFPKSVLGLVAAGFDEGDLLEAAERDRRLEVRKKSIAAQEAAARTQRGDGPWGPDVKVTDAFLDPSFANYYEALGTPSRIYKRDHHRLAKTVPSDKIDPEVVAMLDAIAGTASRAVRTV